MTAFRGACRGVLAAQLNLLDASGALLTGPDEAIVLPKNSIINVTDTQDTRDIAEIDIPCFNSPARTEQLNTGTVEIEFCATTDFESLAFMGAYNGYGDGTTTWGVEPSCGQASCFCTEVDTAASNGFALSIWSCLQGCDGSLVTDADGNLVQCFRGFTRLVFDSVTSSPGIVGEEDAPGTWTVSFNAFSNPSYGNGPGGAMIKIDPITGAPAGPDCYTFQGHTNVLAPIDCAPCTDFPTGLDTQPLALV